MLQQKKIIEKFYKNCNLKTSSRPLYVCKELNKTSIGKSNILKQATNIRYVIAKLSKSIQIRMQTSLNSFLQKILWKLKRAKTEKFSLAVLHKQAKFHYQTAFTSQVIQLNVSCFMLRHLMTSGRLNTRKVQIWLSGEWKELSKWNKIFHRGLSFIKLVAAGCPTCFPDMFFKVFSHHHLHVTSSVELAFHKLKGTTPGNFYIIFLTCFSSVCLCLCLLQNITSTFICFITRKSNLTACGELIKALI